VADFVAPGRRLVANREIPEKVPVKPQGSILVIARVVWSDGWSMRRLVELRRPACLPDACVLRDPARAVEAVDQATHGLELRGCTCRLLGEHVEMRNQDPDRVGRRGSERTHVPWLKDKDHIEVRRRGLVGEEAATEPVAHARQFCLSQRVPEPERAPDLGTPGRVRDAANVSLVDLGETCHVRTVVADVRQSTRSGIQLWDRHG
jgi:hypothetical protein